jgi:arginyl-tRNA synthetase
VERIEGDITMVIFPIESNQKCNPVELGNKIGELLRPKTDEVSRFNVVSIF